MVVAGGVGNSKEAIFICFEDYSCCLLIQWCRVYAFCRLTTKTLRASLKFRLWQGAKLTNKAYISTNTYVSRVRPVFIHIPLSW